MSEIQTPIPCSVSVLTFNSEEGLARCLESLADFAEVIVCDGNSTDTTVEIARSYGARVIPQYDTDEPLTSCAMDKAAVRQRAMDAATFSWRFFMDSDDTLSPEAVTEIRQIVAEPNPKHLVWRMPTRIFIAGKEIRYEATYPSYQTRLMHVESDARFKNPVHDHLVWNVETYPVGTMQSFYNFQWGADRVAKYWNYLKAYVDREVYTHQIVSLGHLFLWSVSRMRTILGYLFWRLPFMYIRHGFRDSMPISIELAIVRYHAMILIGSIGKYIRTRISVILFIETLKGKDLNRILSNIAVREYEAYGRVLDVGGGHDASYWRYLIQRRWHRKHTLDLSRANPDIVVDLEQGVIPVADGWGDTVLLFNVLEHLNNRAGVLKEIKRVLRPGGELIGVIPFLVAVHPDPRDFVRLTEDGLRDALNGSGFVNVDIAPVGRGPITASYSQSEFLLPRLLKVVCIPIVLTLDAMILKFRPMWRDKFPLSYVFCAK